MSGEAESVAILANRRATGRKNPQNAAGRAGIQVIPAAISPQTSADFCVSAGPSSWREQSESNPVWAGRGAHRLSAAATAEVGVSAAASGGERAGVPRTED